MNTSNILLAESDITILTTEFLTNIFLFKYVSNVIKFEFQNVIKKKYHIFSIF